MNNEHVHNIMAHFFKLIVYQIFKKIIKSKFIYEQENIIPF